MKKIGASVIYTGLLLVLSIHMVLAISIDGIRKCSHLMVQIAPCIPYLAFSPQNHSSSPPSACCRPLLSSASFQPSANSTEVCLYLLINNPVLLGFLVDITRMRTLLSQCHFKNYVDLDSVCRGLSIAPPPHDNGNSDLPLIRITGATDLGVPFSQTLVLFSYFAAFILLIVNPIFVIFTQDYEVGTMRINIVNALYFILTSSYCLVDGSALGILEAYSNFLHAILEIVVIIMHVFKMPSMKEVSKQVSLKVFASLAFCASFYYFYESKTEKNRRSIFGWASTGICEVLLLAQTKQLRMRIYNSPTSISLWTATRFILGVASYFFFVSSWDPGSTNEKDWPAIVAGASGVIVGIFQCCHFLPSQCSCLNPHPEPEEANSPTKGMEASTSQHFPSESSVTSFYSTSKSFDNREESIDNAENQEQKLRKLEKRVEYKLTQDEDSLVEKFMTEYETKPDVLQDIFTRVSTIVSMDDLHGQLHGKWMDTVIMDYWLGIVQEQFPNAYFFPSIVSVMYLDWNEVFNPPTGHQWEDYDTLIFPLWEENHFFLIVAYPKEKRWEYYNSIGWSEKNWKCAHKIREFVCSTFRSRGLQILEEWTMENVDSCPLQNNGSVFQLWGVRDGHCGARGPTTANSLYSS